MASWEAKKTTASSINSGNKFNNGDSISAEDINAVVEAALYAQEVDAVNDEVIEQVRINTEKVATIPLVPNRPIYVNRTYATIRKDIELGANDNSYWLESSLGDTYYAFLSTDFNRTALVGDKFGCTCSSLDGYVFNISAQVIKVQGSIVYFKILDKNLNEKDDFVVLYKPNPTLYRTMAFTGVTAEEFVAKDENGGYTFKGYDGHHSIGLNLFSAPPSVGNNFFGTVLLLDDARDQYPTVATFTAVVTEITNNKADYSLVDATIFHKGELDQKVSALEETLSGGIGTKLYRHDINGGANGGGMTIIMTTATPFTLAAQIWTMVPNDYSNPVSKAFVSMYTGMTTAGQVTCTVGNPGDVNAEYSFANFAMSGNITDDVTPM